METVNNYMEVLPKASGVREAAAPVSKVACLRDVLSPPATVAIAVAVII